MDFATAETILRSGEQARPARPHRIGREGMGTEEKEKLAIGSSSASALVGGRRGSGAREHCVLSHEVKPAVVVGVVVGGSGNDGCVQRCE